MPIVAADDPRPQVLRYMCAGSSVSLSPLRSQCCSAAASPAAANCIQCMCRPSAAGPLPAAISGHIAGLSHRSLKSLSPHALLACCAAAAAAAWAAVPGPSRVAAAFSCSKPLLQAAAGGGQWCWVLPPGRPAEPLSGRDGGGAGRQLRAQVVDQCGVGRRVGDGVYRRVQRRLHGAPHRSVLHPAQLLRTQIHRPACVQRLR